MDQFVEAADWIVWQLSGTYVRNACSAGYKGIRQDDRYPSPEFLAEVRPGFADFVTEKLDQPIGRLGARGRVADRAGSAMDGPAARNPGRGGQRRCARHRRGGRRDGSRDNWWRSWERRPAM